MDQAVHGRMQVDNSQGERIVLYRKNRVRLSVWLLVMSAGRMCVGPAVAQLSHAGLYVYSKHGQSADQQSRDAEQCDRSAVEVTGYDPGKPPVATIAQGSLSDQGRTMAKGALVGSAASSAVGAAAGAAVGRAARGAAMGGAGGAVAGLLRGWVVARRDQHAKMHQDQAHHEQHQQEYVRAFAACMDARGYSVR